MRSKEHNRRKRANEVLRESAEIVEQKRSEEQTLDKKEDWGLTEQEWVFCQKYLTHFNMAAAALEAGTNPKWCATRGHEMRGRPRVKAYIEHCLRRFEASRMELMALLFLQATVSMEDFLSIDDAGTASIDLTKARGRGLLWAIKKYRERSERSGASIELYSRQDAQEALLKVLTIQGSATPSIPPDVFEYYASAMRD